jgi:6-phosphogluconolactonase (cycloisomerase 2 family)
MREVIRTMRLALLTALVLVAALSGYGGAPSTTTAAGDFAIQVSPQSVLVPIGFNSTSFQVSIIAIGGFNRPVSVSVTGLPQGVTTTPSTPFTMSPGSSQTLVFNSATDVQPAVQQASFQATSGLLSHNSAVALSIAKPVYAYVATSASGGVAPFHLSGYAVDANTGALASVPGTPTTLADNAAAMVTASVSGGSFLYVMTYTGQPSNSYNLSSYKIEASNGALTPVQQISLGTTVGRWLLIHPSGKLLYTQRTDPTNNQFCILAFLIDPSTGNLTESSCTAETAQIFMIPQPGTYAYLTASDSSVKAYIVNQTDGSLMPLQIQPQIQEGFLNISEPHGYGLYISRPTSFPPPCLNLENWAIDPNSGSLTLAGSLYLYCRGGVVFFNLAGTFAYAHADGYYQHDASGWYLLSVDPNNGNLTELGRISDIPYRSQVEPSQGRYLIGAQPPLVESIPIDPVTGMLSTPIATAPLSDPSTSDFIVVSPLK